jgi:hypothetical protein
VDQPVEGRPERLRHHLRRPPERGTQVTTEEEVTPKTLQTRAAPLSLELHERGIHAVCTGREGGDVKYHW